MKRLFISTLAVGLLMAAMAMSGTKKPSTGNLEIEINKRNPWTTLKLNDNADAFHFVVVSDRTGGHRARVFSQAMQQINLLQPAFVLTVGDLIEGYSKDPTALATEWKELQGYVQKLQMPFFYVAGNHDVSNPLGAKEWESRFGRSYYHFVYRDVLFLLLSTDDPNLEAAKGSMSKEQVAYVEKVLKENPHVRWTIISLHKPIWAGKNVEKSGWLEIEKALTGRSYTVFAGHVHSYQKYVRNGMNYYQLATTGGGSKLRGLPYGEFDHLVWVTMKKEGPVISNILLDGIYSENLQKPITAEATSFFYNRKPTHPVRGTVLFEGAPVAGAKVLFHWIGKDGKQKNEAGDALTDADGTFVLSTYEANDGAPAGQYVVTVVQQEPRFGGNGAPGPNLVPAKYASPETSDLSIQVKNGPNELVLELTK